MSNENKKSPSPLFRKEALQNASVGGYGSIVIFTSNFQIWAARLASIFSVALVFFILLVPYSQKVEMSGYLRPSLGVVTVESAESGVVHTKYVSDGSYVHAGDPLFLLVNDESNENYASANLTSKRILISKKLSLIREIQRLQNEVDIEGKVADSDRQNLIIQTKDIEEQIALQVAHISFSEETLRRYKTLLDAHAVSIPVEREKEIDVAVQKAKKIELEQVASERQEEISSLEEKYLLEKEENGVKSEELGREISQIDQELLANSVRAGWLIRAQTDGIISDVNFDLGQVVNSRQTIAEIVPRGSIMEGEAYVSSQAIKSMKIGDDVMIRYSSFPFQSYGQFHGAVVNISEVATPPDSIPDLLIHDRKELEQSEDSYYRVRLRIPSQAIKSGNIDVVLKPGMKFDATVVVEKQPIYRWMFYPVKRMLRGS
ncbi:membrane fusion protein [Paraburkholderia sp. GAS206C]|uniref:HlyD family secretion protein n=1 Tax=unclassified Paraburkholderia TaxID=2615204 RepID=UPI003D192385